MGCPCHIIHNTAQKGSKASCEGTHCDVDDFLINLYYYFNKSTKRKNDLAEFSSFCDVVYRKLIHHITVRWLSLQVAVDRALQQYEALYSYFCQRMKVHSDFKGFKPYSLTQLLKCISSFIAVCCTVL